MHLLSSPLHTLIFWRTCNDYLNVDAISKYDTEYVFSEKTEINRALNGVYAQLLNGSTYGGAYMSTFCLNSDVDMAK